MNRAKWKSFITLKGILNSRAVEIACRKLKVLPHYVGRNFLVHNGKKFFKININSKMIGYKFGHFSFTKKNGKAN